MCRCYRRNRAVESVAPVTATRPSSPPVTRALASLVAHIDACHLGMHLHPVFSPRAPVSHAAIAETEGGGVFARSRSRRHARSHRRAEVAWLMIGNRIVRCRKPHAVVLEETSAFVRPGAARVTRNISSLRTQNHKFAVSRQTEAPEPSEKYVSRMVSIVCPSGNVSPPPPRNDPRGAAAIEVGPSLVDGPSSLGRPVRPATAYCRCQGKSPLDLIISKSKLRNSFSRGAARRSCRRDASQVLQPEYPDEDDRP